MDGGLAEEQSQPDERKAEKGREKKVEKGMGEKKPKINMQIHVKH